MSTTPQRAWRLVEFVPADCSCCWDENEIEQTSDYDKVEQWLAAGLEPNREVQQLHTWVSLDWQRTPESRIQPRRQRW